MRSKPSRLLLLGIAGSLIGLPSAHSQITIDNFFVTTSLLQATPGNPVDEDSTLTIAGSPAGRRLTASAAGGFSLDTQVDGVSWIVDGGGTAPGSANAQMEYASTSLNLGTNYFFEVALDRVAGSPVLGVILQNTGQSITLTSGVELTPTTNGYSVFFDVRSLTGYNAAFLNGVDDITVLLGDSDQDFFADATLIQFSPVPEPSTVGLLAGGAGLLWLAVRRRVRLRRG